MKKILVVVCAFNEEKYLPKALNALCNQSYQRSEYDILVVDNASTDKTAEIAKQSGVIVISETKKGIPFAMKAGYDYALNQNYAYLAMTDADSEVSYNWIKTIMAIFDNELSVVGQVGPVGFYNIPKFLNWIVIFVFKSAVYLNYLINGFMQFTGNNMAFRIDAYQRTTGVDLRFHISADVELAKRLSKYGRIVFNPQMQVNVSARRFQKQPIKALYQYLKSTFYIRKNKPSNEILDDIR